jgi:protocatechuate 3,4-dioxygenase beta subunit
MKSLGILALAIAAALPAQNTRGYISGTINDASGAHVGGVYVEVENLGTGARSSTASNEHGVYRFAAVEPGSYRVRYT